MAKRADVELRIRSKNLAAKDLGELNTELDKFVKNQERQADSAALASRSLRELNTEQRELTKLSGELSRRSSLLENAIGKQSDLAAAKGRVNELRKEMAELLSIKSKGTFLGDIDKSIKKVKTELVTAEKVFDRSAVSVGKLEKALAAVGVDTTDLSGELTKVTSTLNRSKAAVIDQAANINRLSTAQDKVAASARKQAEAQRFVNEQTARQGARRADASVAFAGIDQWERQRNAIRLNGAEVARVQGIHDRFAAVTARNATVQRRLKTETENVTQSTRRQGLALRDSRGELDRYGSAAERAGRKNGILSDTGRKSLSVYQRIRGELLSLAAAYVGLFQAVNLFSSAMKTSEQRQAINAQLLTVNSNNARLAARDQKFLREEADRLGMVYDDLATKYANFAISAKATGLSDSATKKAFSQAANIVVGMRLSAEDADGVFRAFVQVMSKARVQAEELRGQLGDRLPGAVAAFANANKIALSELDDYLKKGKGNVQSFLNFLDEYARTVESSVEAGSKTVYADIRRLKTAYNDFLELVATSGTSDELQKAVTSLTTALKGDQGKKFAQELATALSSVVKVLQFVIQNFDTFVTLAKAFIALNIVKGIYGLSQALQGTVVGLVNSVTNLRKFYAGAVAARAASLGLSTAQRGLLMLLGPVGIALAAVTVALYGMGQAAAASEARMESFLATMRAVKSVQSSADADEAQKKVRRDLDESIGKLRELQEARDTAYSVNPLKNFSSAVTMVKNDLYSTGQLETAITAEQVKQEGLQVSLLNLGKKRAEFKAQEAEEDRKIREAEEAAAKAASVKSEDGKESKGPKGPKAPTESQLRAAENSRANASRALAKEILDLDQSIFDARIDGEARTAEQVAKNYELSVRKIESQIAEQQLGLDRLEQNARTANAGALTAGDAESLRVAKDRVEQLNLALNARALEVSYLADVSIGERKVNDLLAERDAKISAINTEVELGLKTEVDGRREALALQQEYSTSITESINGLIELLQALPPDLFARLGGAKMIADLESIRLKAQQVKTELQLIGENLGGQFAAGAASAFGVLAKGIAGFLQGTNSIGDAFKGAAQAFQSFLADFLVGIGQAIMQAIILKAIMNALNGTSGGYVSAAVGALSGSNHDGGIVGQDGKARWMPGSALKRAKRFHDGGLPGLKANEVPTILERGEEVLTADDPRHVLNGGAGGGSPVNIEVVNAIDSPSVVAAGLSDKATRQTFYNFMRADKNQIRQLLGIR